MCVQLGDCIETCAFANARGRSRYHNRLALEALCHGGGHCSSRNMATEWCAEYHGPPERWRLQKLRNAQELLLVRCGKHTKTTEKSTGKSMARLNFIYLRI